MQLVVGLGNPGRDYQDHRHNIGFVVADELCARLRLGAFKPRFGGELVHGETAGRKLALLKPQQFMNLSGQAVQRAAAFYQVEPGDVVVVHDEIDLDFGRVKVKSGGGHGGHNGLRSVTEHIGPGFIRVRCGVGHPGDKERVIGHVLGAFSRAEQKDVPLLVASAADAVLAVVTEGPIAAMNRVNRDPAAP